MRTKKVDKLAAMKAFAMVAKTLNFAEASRQLSLSRSQVNKLVIGLEDDLGVSLFSRTTRKVTLTATGRSYLERVQQILSDIQETESLVRDDQESPSGSIKINAPMSFGTMHLSNAIIEFLKLYPNINVHMLLSDDLIDPVSNGFDMTIRIAKSTDSISLIEHQIVEAKRIICASPSFLEKQPIRGNIEQLKDLPCLHYGNLPSGTTWKLSGPEGEKNIRVNGSFCSNNAEVLKDACAAGLGLALLPTFIAGKEIQSGQLKQVFSDYKAPEIHLNLLYPPNRHLSARNKLFVKFILQKFGDKPYWDL